MSGPPVEERLARIARARDSAKDLMGQPPARWENECEGIFKEFRLSVVHLRRDQQALDSLDDKEAAWRFICKFCRERPFWHDRCTEVLRILMLSDAWMKKFLEEPLVSIDDLPAPIAEEFAARAKEVEGQKGGQRGPTESKPAANGQTTRGPTSARQADPWSTPPPDVQGPLPQVPSGMAIVVQRCVRARVQLDEPSDRWSEVKRGLVVSVSFAQKATQDCVRSAARFVLTAKLSTSEHADSGGFGPGRQADDGAESVVDLCCRGEEQGILIISQTSLLSNVGKKDLGLSYDRWSHETAASQLYTLFADTLGKFAADLVTGPTARQPTVVAGAFGGRQQMEMFSSGPFMHSFNF